MTIKKTASVEPFKCTSTGSSDSVVEDGPRSIESDIKLEIDLVGLDDTGTSLLIVVAVITISRRERSGSLLPF